jgi:hypothetical protein
MAYTEAMKKAGVLLGNSGLRPTSEATTVRAPGGKQSVLNGPFAETKEQLGGYFLIEVPDLDAALSCAARCPAVEYGAIEVRPVWGVVAKTAEAVARASYGKLVTFLAARTRDVAGGGRAVRSVRGGARRLAAERDPARARGVAIIWGQHIDRRRFRRGDRGRPHRRPLVIDRVDPAPVDSSACGSPRVHQLLSRSFRTRDESEELVQFLCVAALLDFVVVESDGCYRSLRAEFGHVMQNLLCARTALCTEERHLFEIFFVRSYVGPHRRADVTGPHWRAEND